MEAYKVIFLASVLLAIAVFIYGKCRNQKQRKEAVEEFLGIGRGGRRDKK